MSISINTIKSNERMIAWFLMLGGVILPLALEGLLSGPYDYARLSGNIMGMILMSVLIGYAATIGRTLATKNRVALIIGVLIFGYSVMASYRVWHDAQALRNAANNLLSIMDNTKAQINSATPSNQPNADIPITFDNTNGNGANFLNGTQPILKKFADKSIDLNNRMVALPMVKVLAPDSLISKEGIAQSRAILSKQKELIAERGKNLVEYWAEVITYFKTANVDEANRKSAMDNFLRGKPAVEKLYGDLDKSQIAFVDEAYATLDLVEKNLGRLQVDNGRLLFPDQTLLDAFNNHIKNLDSLGKEETKITQQIQNLSTAGLDQIKKDIGK